MSDHHHSTAVEPLDIPSAGWEAFALAALIRDSLTLAGGASPAGLWIKGDAQEALMLGLDRLVTLARSIAVVGD